MLNYPIAIFKDEGMDNYAAIVPDIDGCFPLGDTIDDTVQEAQSLIYDHIEYMVDKGMSFDFHTSDIETLRMNADFQDALAWAIVNIDENKFSTKQVRFNVSWPEYLLQRVDSYAEKNHETRSGFLAKAVHKALV